MALYNWADIGAIFQVKKFLLNCHPGSRRQRRGAPHEHARVRQPLGQGRFPLRCSSSFHEFAPYLETSHGWMSLNNTAGAGETSPPSQVCGLGRPRAVVPRGEGVPHARPRGHPRHPGRPAPPRRQRGGGAVPVVARAQQEQQRQRRQEEGQGEEEQRRGEQDGQRGGRE